ncbi:hypothetical protein Q5P01_014281 [Channa striata]|uniref:Uncharacterized protein n=1 Tax=Channa striata TaxID=64152 RepID=A0AA88SMQ2_CHASR|nr:hypothetical protein Q5P01_014281 [Channa striata]
MTEEDGAWAGGSVCLKPIASHVSHVRGNLTPLCVWTAPGNLDVEADKSKRGAEVKCHMLPKQRSEAERGSSQSLRRGEEDLQAPSGSF